jgi:hypothetical protein
VWLLAGFFVCFGVNHIRSDYVVGRGGVRVDRRTNPYSFWSGVVIAFMFSAFLLVLGAILFFGRIKL